MRQILNWPGSHETFRKGEPPFLHRRPRINPTILKYPHASCTTNRRRRTKPSS